jgi:hypothetical protein
MISAQLRAPVIRAERTWYRDNLSPKSDSQIIIDGKPYVCGPTVYLRSDLRLGIGDLWLGP